MTPTSSTKRPLSLIRKSTVIEGLWCSICQDFVSPGLNLSFSHQLVSCVSEVRC